MTLPEIFVQLPDDIQQALEKGLEGWGVNTSATAQEILHATSNMIEHIKEDYPDSIDNHELLDQVPQAVVDLLF